MGVIIHIYMEIYKKTPCGATFISNKQDCHVFFFFSFFFYKIGEQEGRTGPAGWEVVPVGGGRCGQWGKRVNMVQKCRYMYVNAKMIPVETIPRMGEGGIKKHSGGGEIKYDIFDTL
jgi:hypothetical protein